MKKIAVMLILVLGFVTLVGCSTDNESKMLKYDLRVVVEDLNGDPADGAEVTITGEKETRTKTADENGVVEFKDLVSDGYNVRADDFINNSLYSGEVTATIDGRDTKVEVKCDKKMEPAEAPAEPSSVDVGLFTDANATTSIAMNWTDWSSAEKEALDFNGNAVKSLPTDFVGYGLGSSLDASGKSTLHVQVWTSGHSALKIKLVDFGGTGYDTQDDNTEFEYTASISSTEQWVQLDIPLTEWSSEMNISDINQIILTGVDGNETGAKTYYIDNLYID